MDTQFGDIFKKHRLAKDKNQADMGKILNVDRSTIGKWETNSSVPSMSTIKQIADYFNVSTDYLLGRTQDPKPQKKKGIRLPIIGRIQAGTPIEAIENYEDDWEEIDEDLARRGEYIALRVRGESMTPRILDGDVVIVKLQSDVDSGDIAVIMINDCDATVKKLTKKNNGIMITAFNPLVFEPIFFTQEDLIKKNFRVIGKVVELRGKF